jgi:hypothetical protein
MTSAEKQEKLNALRESAKDAQAELGFIALQREAQDARWEALKQQLAAGQQEYNRVAEAPVAEAAE